MLIPPLAKLGVVHHVLRPLPYTIAHDQNNELYCSHLRLCARLPRDRVEAAHLQSQQQ